MLRGVIMFYQRFIPLCESTGVKPSHVAKQLGLASGSPTAWKNGTVPDREALVKIADFFDCSVDYLLGRTDDPQAHKSSNNVSVGDISGNSGIVGNIVSNSINSTPLLNEQEMALLNLYRKLDVISQARVLASIADLPKNLQTEEKQDV